MNSPDLYKEKLAAQLKEWEARIETLEARIGSLGAEMRVKSQEEIEKLRAKQQAAREMLERFGDSSAQTWQEAKHAADKVWIDIKTHVDEIRARF